jgi:hypothetical protein
MCIRLCMCSEQPFQKLMIGSCKFCRITRMTIELLTKLIIKFGLQKFLIGSNWPLFHFSHRSQLSNYLLACLNTNIEFSKYYDIIVFDPYALWDGKIGNRALLSSDRMLESKIIYITPKHHFSFALFSQSFYPLFQDNLSVWSIRCKSSVLIWHSKGTQRDYPAHMQLKWKVASLRKLATGTS